jgi:hypothetical protein
MLGEIQMTTPKERAEIKAQEVVRESWDRAPHLELESVLVAKITNALLEFSQEASASSTVGDLKPVELWPSPESIKEERIRRNRLHKKLVEKFEQKDTLLAGICFDAGFQECADWLTSYTPPAHPPRVVVPESVSDEDIDKESYRYMKEGDSGWIPKTHDEVDRAIRKAVKYGAKWCRAALSKDSAKREGKSDYRIFDSNRCRLFGFC